MMPGSRRRSREQEDLLDDVPISIRRRTHSVSAATELRAPVVPAGTNSQLSDSQASPLVESVDRAGTTGIDPTMRMTRIPGNLCQKLDCW